MYISALEVSVDPDHLVHVTNHLNPVITPPIYDHAFCTMVFMSSSGMHISTKPRLQGAQPNVYLCYINKAWVGFVVASLIYQDIFQILLSFFWDTEVWNFVDCHKNAFYGN